MEEPNKDTDAGADSLEEKDTTVTESASGVNAVDEATGPSGKKKKNTSTLLQKISTRVNVYLLVFIFLILAAGILAFVLSKASERESAKQNDISSQELTQDAVDSLSSNEATVGDPKQLLNIESNAVFSGSVLIEDGLDVAGAIKVGGALDLPGITVSGTSSFDEVQLNTLSIAGDASIQGALTIQESLTVNGTASFAAPIAAPSINIDSLSISGDIQFNRHIDAGGATPGVSIGAATGAGGTVTISGTDSAGTVTANVGTSPGGGIIATVTFSASFTDTPHVVVTPVDAPASTLYVANRTTTGFQLRTTDALPTGSMSFDYIVID